jgi:GT2 family glycosyltransferase
MNAYIVSVRCGGLGFECGHKVKYYDNSRNEMTPCEAYQGLLDVCHEPIIVYGHDDVSIHDPDWLSRVLTVFSNPNVVVVGLGGAISLGHPDLYKKPYKLQDMARGGYVSNQTDWATHGGRERGMKRVAVVDAFFMAVRRDWLVSIGGWPVKHLSHHCLDLWICCEAARHSKEVWMVGAECTHHGGGTSTKPIYAEAKWLQGGTLESDHQEPHRWLYENYRDVLPIRV